MIEWEKKRPKKASNPGADKGTDRKQGIPGTITKKA
jgi:hypothetical protein